MNEKIKAIMEYAKVHKKEIIITTLVGTGTIVLCVMGVKYAKVRTVVKKAMPMMSVAQIGIGKVVDVWNGDDRTYLIIDDIPVEKCGEFGEALRANFAVPDGETVSMIMALSNQYETIG